jgi:hypothetical protein
MQKPEGIVVGDSQNGLYLYCLTRADVLLSRGEKGIKPGISLSFQTFGNIAAVFQIVPLIDFLGERGKQNLSDPDWVGPRIIQHEEVIETVMAGSSVVPARFGTIFSTSENLKCFLHRNQKRIMDFLDDISGKSEWAVKGILDRNLARKKIASEIIQKEYALLSVLSAGKRYFEEKKISSQADAALKIWLGETFSKVCNDFQHHASRFCERKAQSQKENNADIVINWAYLVSLGSFKEFEKQVIEESSIYKKNGLTFQLSGPWPPYSFSPSFEMEW